MTPTYPGFYSLFNVQDEDDLRRVLFERVYKDHGYTRDQLEEFEVSRLFISLMQQSDWRLPAATYTPETGYRFHRGASSDVPGALMTGGVEQRKYVSTLDTLLNNRRSYGGTLVQDKRGDHRYGTRGPVLMPETIVDNMIGWFAEAVKDKKLTLPEPLDPSLLTESTMKRREYYTQNSDYFSQVLADSMGVPVGSLKGANFIERLERILEQEKELLFPGYPNRHAGLAGSLIKLRRGLPPDMHWDPIKNKTLCNESFILERLLQTSFSATMLRRKCVEGALCYNEDNLREIGECIAFLCPAMIERLRAKGSERGNESGKFYSFIINGVELELSRADKPNAQRDNAERLIKNPTRSYYLTVSQETRDASGGFTRDREPATQIVKFASDDEALKFGADIYALAFDARETLDKALLSRMAEQALGAVVGR